MLYYQNTINDFLGSSQLSYQLPIDPVFWIVALVTSMGLSIIGEPFAWIYLMCDIYESGLPFKRIDNQNYFRFFGVWCVLIIVYRLVRSKSIVQAAFKYLR